MSQQNNWKGFCMTCKYFEQGESCSFCGNPKQSDKNKKEYLYYSFSCDLWDEGVAQSRIDYSNRIKKVVKK